MSFNDEYLKLRKKRLAGEETDYQESQSAPRLLYKNKTQALVPPSEVNNDDIAPVRPTTEEEDKRKWFQKGAFEDGYQFGDLSKTISGTGNDLRAGLISGILGMGERVVDFGAYVAGGVGGLFGADDFRDNMQEFIAKDLYDERAVAEKIVRGTTLPSIGGSHDMKDSILGDKSDSLVESGGQLLGTVALQSVGVPWFVTSGVTSFGGEVENASNQGASYGEAGLSGLISAGAEILTEKMFGGSGLGEKGLINTDLLTKGISNKAVKLLADYGIDIAGEGAEEAFSQFFSNLGTALYKEENLGEILFNEEAVDGYLESFIGGAALGGVANVGKTVNSAKTGRDYRTGLTQNEQTVFDKVLNDRIAEAEENGKKLSSKEKSEIYDDVMNKLEKGYIDIEDIEAALGGDTYMEYKNTIANEDALQKEFDELGALKKSDFTAKQDDRYNELKQLLEDAKKNDTRSKLKANLSENVFTLAKDSKLVESYNERARRGQAFEADVSKYDAKQQEIVKKAIESGVLNNTRRTHELVDMIAKISADKGVSFDFINNKKLKESGFAVDGATVNGYYNKATKTIGVNIEGAKYLNSVVGHEVTHVLEGTEVYTELQKAMFAYAESKGEYASRRKHLESLYKAEDIDSELTADLVGDYLFTDSDFIKNLSVKHRNVFQKIYDEIKYLCKVATAGSKEARELERVKKLFEDVYRESGTQESTEADKGGDVQHSLSDSDGKQLTKEQSEFFKDSKMRDENGNLKVMYHGSQDAGFHVFDSAMSDDDTSFFFVDRNDVAASYSGTSETYEAKTIRTADDMNKFLAEIGYDHYQAVERNGKFELLENNEHVAYSDTAQGLYDEFCWYEGVGEGDANYKVYLNLTNPLVVDAEGRNWNDVSREFSQELADKYNSLTAQEKEALMNLASWEDISIFRDEIRQALADTETGTPGSYDVDFARNVRSAYEKLGGNKVNMYDLFSIASGGFSAESINQFAVNQMTTRDYAQKAKAEGYDGVIFNNIHDNGGYSNGSEGASTVAVAFNSEQIKSVANAKPTSNPDIRYSLGDGREVEVVNGIAVAPNVAEAMKSEEYRKPNDYMTKYSVSSTPAWEKNYLAQHHDEKDHQVVDAIRRFTDKMVQDDAVRGYVPTGDYKYTSWGPLRSNVEYIRTFDMDTSCPRTFQFLNFRDAIQRKAGRYLSYNESINLLELMRAYGQQIPCCYCYVENKRVLLSASYNNFFGFRNAVMTAKTEADAEKAMYGYSEKKGLPDASRKALARWRSDMGYNPSLTEVWTATNTARNSVLNYLDAQMESGNINEKTAESKLNTMVLEQFGIKDKGAIAEIQTFVKDWAYDTLAKTPHIYNTDNDTSVSVVDERALALNHEALAYSKSASSAKNVENYVPYTDQLKNISKEEREYIMGMGGIRKHSSNDFRMDYVQDYFLFYADLAADKWTGHTYTKSADFTKIFACTNDRINMSVAFYEDADGTLRENIDEGASWKDVRELRKAYKNVGSMAMVTSDNQLSYALNSDWIDMIIPFHASGLDKAVWYNLRMWNDYTSKQGERFYNADTMKQRLKEAGVEIPKVAKSEDVQALFEKTFKIKHIYGKKGEVLKPHFFPGDTYVNGQLVPGHHNDVATYFKLCEEYGVHPRFYGIKVTDTNGNQIDVTEHPSYLKLIKETSRTDSAQEEIQFNFGNYDAFLKMTPFEYAMKRLQEEAKNGGFENTKADPYGVVDEFINEYLDKDRPLGYLTDRAKETREILLEMSKENAKQQADIVEKEVNALSLSAQGETPTKYGNFNISGDDVRLEAPMQESVAPIREDVAKNATTTPIVSEEEKDAPEGFAPITEEKANALQSENIASITDEDAPPEAEAPYYEEPSAPASPKNPFSDRDYTRVGSTKTKAFVEENPDAQPFFQEAAQAMLGDLRNSQKGQKWYNDEVYYESGGENGIGGVQRETTADIADLLDGQYHYTYQQIDDALNLIINGEKLNACAKRIEFALNERLLNGYTDINGMQIPPNQEYINLLNQNQTAEDINQQGNVAFTDSDVPPMEDIGPVKPTEAYQSQPKATKVTEAPIKEGYEAIKPKREPSNEPRLKRVKDGEASSNGKQRKWVGTSTDSDAVDGKVLPEDLDQSAIHYQPISNKVSLGKANTKLNGMGYESSVAYFNGQFANKSVSLEDVVLGERLIQEAIKRGDTKTAGELIQNVAILGTELGQKVQALSIIKRLTPEGQLRLLQKTVERGKTKGDKAYEGVEITQEMIDHILKTYGKDGKYDQAKLNKAVEDVKQKIADQMKVTKMDKVNAWRYLSMLGNPKTHIRNLVSNVAMRGTLAVKNAVARTIETYAPVGNRTKTWEKASDDVKAFAQKTTEEMKSILSDGGKYSEDASIKEKRAIFKNKVLNGVYEFNSDLLTKEDWWFSKPAFTNALSEYLTANGIRTAEDIKNNPKLVEKAKQYATEQSQIATFRQYSWLANKINEIERRNTATGIAVGAVLPFKKTPINIAKTALNYSPLGFAKTLTYDISQVKNGKMEASELVDHLSQNITGSALTLVGYMLASAGLLNGAGDDDKEGEYDYQLGKQAYSINIGGATFSLSWLSPIAMPLFVGTNAYEQLVEGKEWNGDTVIETLAQTLDPLSEMSFLSSLDSVLSSYDSGIQKFAGIGETAAQSYITQFAPTLLSQVASTLDDTKRSTKVSRDSGFKFFDETINKLKFKIPFLRNTLEPTTDIWGNEVKQSENILTRAFESFFAPYAKRDDISTYIDEEIKDLYAQTGDTGVIPSIPSDYFSYDGVKYEMSAEEYTAFKKTYGQTACDLMDSLFNTDTYQYASAEERADMVNKVYDYARDEARKEFLYGRDTEFTNATSKGNEYYKENPIRGAIEKDVTPDEYTFSEKNPEKYEFLKENGVSFEDYQNGSEEFKEAYSWAFENPEKFLVSKAVTGDVVEYRKYASDLYDIKADKDEDGKSISGSRKEKVMDYINSLDVDYGARLILFKNEYNADDTYNYVIVDYLNSREDISYKEMETILKELGFDVDSKGNITWD